MEITMKIAGFGALAITSVVLVGVYLQPAAGESESESMECVDSLLHVPEVDYRREWVLLGSFSVLADEPPDGGKELHVVYTAPENVEAYREDGEFPDGAVLVKDVYSTATEAMTTGTVSYADALVGRFVMFRDADDEHADESPLWGDGWGWAFYEGTETTDTVTTDYTVDCLGCHEPVRDQNLIYVQGYPVLRDEPR
jgi:hypothetical protein